MHMIPPGTYLIAGSAGQLGTHALLRLKDKPGVSVVAFFHQSPPTVSGTNIFPRRGDLTNLEDCRQVTQGIDFVWSFAGQLSTSPVLARDPIKHINRNLLINQHLLESAYLAGVKKVVWMSSSTGYPSKTTPCREKDFMTGDPPNPYFSVGWMYRYCEIMCRAYATRLSRVMSATILRPTTVYSEYGSFDLATCHVFPALIAKVLMRKNPIEIWGNGETKRDLIYGDDVIDACLLAFSRNEPFEVFNVGCGRSFSLNQILRMILRQDDYPDAVVRHCEKRAQSVPNRQISLAQSRKILGFRAKTSLAKGIRILVRHQRSIRQGDPV